MPHDGPHAPHGFPSTHWSMIERAGQPASEEQRRALGTLLTRYLPALKAHLVHHLGVAPDRADDLVQGFVAGKVLERDLVAQADRNRGRFRTFLLTSLQRYVISEDRKARARRRSPGNGRLVSLGELC